MAEIVLGIGSSHGPTMKTPPERWAALGEKDQEDTRFDFAALRANPRPGIEKEVNLEKFTERYNLLQENIAKVAEVIRQASPDGPSRRHHTRQRRMQATRNRRVPASASCASLLVPPSVPHSGRFGLTRRMPMRLG